MGIWKAFVGKVKRVGTALKKKFELTVKLHENQHGECIGLSVQLRILDTVFGLAFVPTKFMNGGGKALALTR
jgi:hypothetical protein